MKGVVKNPSPLLSSQPITSLFGLDCLVLMEENQSFDEGYRIENILGSRVLMEEKDTNENKITFQLIDS